MRPLLSLMLLAIAPVAIAAPADGANAPVAPPPTFNPAASLAPLVEAVTPAVAAIEVEGVRSGAADLPPGFEEFFGPFLRDFDPGPRVVRGEGSGFVIDADGLLVTNHHVVDGATTVRARFADGTTVTAEVIGSDPRTDLALLQLPRDRTWAHVTFGDSDALRVGDWVVAMGNPLGLGITVTAGIVSGKSRNLGNNPYDEFLQTDAAINQGNSGGPLFDLNGRVVGVNSAIIQYANTVGFSIPSNLARRIVEDLRDGGVVRRGFLGIGLQDPDEDLARALGLASARGALVTEIEPGLPADAAGLRRGDVVVDVDGTPVADAASLIRAIGRYKPGERVALGLWRDGRRKEVRVQLAARPDDPTIARTPQPRAAPAPTTETTSALGFRVRPTTATSTEAAALEVVAVDAEGPARGRLMAGDRIVAVNRVPVTTTAALAEALEASGETVLLEILRGETRRFVAIARR